MKTGQFVYIQILALLVILRTVTAASWVSELCTSTRDTVTKANRVARSYRYHSISNRSYLI